RRMRSARSLRVRPDQRDRGRVRQHRRDVVAVRVRRGWRPGRYGGLAFVAVVPIVQALFVTVQGEPVSARSEAFRRPRSGAPEQRPPEAPSAPPAITTDASPAGSGAPETPAAPEAPRIMRAGPRGGGRGVVAEPSGPDDGRGTGLGGVIGALTGLRDMVAGTRYTLRLPGADRADPHGDLGGGSAHPADRHRRGAGTRAGAAGCAGHRLGGRRQSGVGRTAVRRGRPVAVRDDGGPLCRRGPVGAVARGARPG